MKTKLILLGLTFWFAALSVTPSVSTETRLRRLYRNKQFFELRDALKQVEDIQASEFLFYRSVVANKFHQPTQSIDLALRYLEATKSGGTKLFLKDTYELLADNYLKTFQYKNAAEAYQTILASFAVKMRREDGKDIKNSFRLWSALSSVPPQTVTRQQAGSTIKTNKNVLGLTQWPVEINSQTHYFIFDTGANLSTVTETYATKLRMTIIDVPISVGSITGKKSIARLAVAPEMKIGDAVIKNAVFLVFKDKDFYVAPAQFQIDAILGFPIAEALQEISFHKNGEVDLPGEAGTGGEQNMFLDGLNPAIGGIFRGRRLTFTLDSGADASLFYPTFFRLYEREIRSKYKTKSVRLGGAGGITPVVAYHATDLVIQFSGKDAKFTSADILTKSLTEKSHYYYGNLGQDLMSQFEKMTINFKAMSIVFE